MARFSPATVESVDLVPTGVGSSKARRARWVVARFRSLVAAGQALGALSRMRPMGRRLTLRSSFSPAAPDLGIFFPLDPDLEYAYPPPSPQIVANIAAAIAAVPTLYTQVLHLMNKMNLPPPSVPATPSTPLPNIEIAPPDMLEALPAYRNYRRGEPAATLFIKNIDHKNVTEDDLQRLFSAVAAGRRSATGSAVEPASVHVRLMKEGRMKGQAFVKFPSVELATEALERLHGGIVRGRPMVIAIGREHATAILLGIARDVDQSAQARLDALAKVQSVFDLVRRTIPNHEATDPLLVTESVIKRQALISASAGTEIRVATYKIMRILVSPSSVRILFSSHIDLFIIRTLIRDPRYDSEREQAIRFIRACIEEPEGPHFVPMSVVRALAAIAEQLDDRFRTICLETICELAVRHPELACFSGGTKAMFAALLDGPPEMLDPIVSTFLHLLDSPASRRYIRPHVELEMVISQFVDAYTSKTGYSIEKLVGSASVIRKVLSSWTGLVYFSIGNMRSVRSIVDALGLPNEDTRALIEITQDRSREISEMAILLLAGIMSLCSKQLPAEFASKVQSLPSLFRLATNFHDEGRRHLATSKLSQILNISRSAASAKTTMPAHPGLLSFNCVAQTRLDCIRVHAGLQIDEAQLRNMLNDSEVIGAKDFTKWNWDIIDDIVSGPLLNPKRYDDLVRNTKFVSRLIAFFRPTSRQFSDMPRNSPKVLRTAVELVRNLASTVEGSRVLADTKFLLEIADQLGQHTMPVCQDLVKNQASVTPDNVFLKERMEATMSSDYFWIIRAFTHRPDGLRLLEQCGIYNIFYQLADLRGREDLSNAILTSMDYSADSHPRVILAKMLTAGSRALRFTATLHLEQLAAAHETSFHEWGIPLLVVQLYDPVADIVQVAVGILQRLCRRPQNLAAFAQLRPDIQHLAVVGNDLLLQMLALPSGFKYLAEAGYVESEIDYWFEHGIYQYVTHAELSISEGLAKSLPKSAFDTLDKDLVLNMDGRIPIHLYGELAKTSGGVAYLEMVGHTASFLDRVRAFRDCIAPAAAMELKAALWALGAIGSSASGLAILEDGGAITLIMEVLRAAPVITVRGTCFYVLGMIGRSPKGRGILEDLGWLGESIHVPGDPESVLQFPEWEFSGSWPARQGLTFKPLHYRADAIEAEILTCIGNLSNHILSTAASKRLAVIRQQHPHYFVKPELCVQAWRICTAYHYRVATRRFIQELFERLVFDSQVLKVVDQMDGVAMVYPLDDKDSARHNENAFKSSLSLLAKDPDGKGPSAANTANRMSLQPARVIRGF
ncbi:hypothetical protein HK105_208318 [Polyrhizophydium stewartii]|uniref:RRM domain-containing protein n=1 Tax=Polyrhizophydium stewartii TaxID=2732419 RepID=A0ABR4MY42_9FUNG